MVIFAFKSNTVTQVAATKQLNSTHRSLLNIGNQKQTQAGGDENGANLRSGNYYANSLNQYTNRDVPEIEPCTPTIAPELPMFL